MKRLTSLLAALLTTVALAQAVTPEAAATRLFTQPLQAAWFTQAVLNAAPIAQLQAIVDQLKGQLGELRGVTLSDPARNLYTLAFERGTLPTTLVLDEQGRVAGLFFATPQLSAASLEGALAPFRELQGRASVIVLQGENERVGLNADAPLAVGSTFKLAVLAALDEQVRAGKHSWAEVVTLKANEKSLPSGFLQNWGEGTPVTVATLATLMISVSDNTATDILLNLVGREAVEALSPRNRPFLSTREAFLLKDPANAGLLARYREGTLDAKRSVVNELALKPLPSVSPFTGGVLAPEVEWFMSVRESCALMARVSDLPALSANPGPASPGEWARVAFKGGSEPGVINLTTALTGKDGRTWCVSATWNDLKPLDETRFQVMYSSLLGSLQQTR